MSRRFDIITIGNLSRNRYWGESEEQPRRSALCTCTLVTIDNYRILVDPSCEVQMAFELDRRTGLKPAKIDAVFITHEHGDHHVGLINFPAARWLAGPQVANAINASGHYRIRIEPVTGEIAPGLTIIPTPGHTMSHRSLRFDCDGFAVLIAGDAVMTRDFWNERKGYFNSVDAALAAQTITELSAWADIVIPGHDNYFMISPREIIGEQR
jgi:glyoxylase-like metal-dependent hydrolase (beta-lactamase superfamily II)